MISNGLTESLNDPEKDRQDPAPLSITYVPVGDAGNSADPGTHLGCVTTPYEIGKYEVTVAEWSVFLNAVASKKDLHGFYDERMSTDPVVASIERLLSNDGFYYYLPITGREGSPITYVSYYNALRFCNWLQNGQPNQLQGEDLVEASVENGAYSFYQLDNGEEGVVANKEALYFLPSEDQWIKAAYYAGGGLHNKYWLYPTQHDLPPNNGDPTNMIVETGSCYSNIATVSIMKSGLQPVDFYEKSQGAYGTCDLGGNVAEWITKSDSAHSKNLIPMTRGQSWASQSYEESQRTYPAKTYDSPEVALGNNSIGFRIARLGHDFPNTKLLSHHTTLKTTNTLLEDKNHALKIIGDIIQWGLFFVDVSTLVLMLGGVICSMVLLILGPVLFPIALQEVPLLALCFSLEISFSVVLLLTFCSFLMDWMTDSGYTFDFVFSLLDVFKLLF
jgi:formylglycine-generating enzyme required for sulfatase activity